VLTRSAVIKNIYLTDHEIEGCTDKVKGLVLRMQFWTRLTVETNESKLPQCTLPQTISELEFEVPLKKTVV
jgi:hypothetical protein